MSTRKGQNSILFLTTLGVYLGLVLVGAPHVLAQAATSRQFDVKDEIEKTDEFDGNPDIDALKSLITTSLESSIASFISEAKNSDAISLASDRSLKTTRNFCADDWVEISDPLRSAQDDGDPFVRLHHRLDVGDGWDFSTVPHFIQPYNGPAKQKFCKAFSVSTTLDSKGLSSKLLFSQIDESRAFLLAGYLNDFLFNRAHGFKDPIVSEAYHYTHVTADYCDLVVETRLPRGSLSALLAKDAK